jgi:hypothetical protein
MKSASLIGFLLFGVLALPTHAQVVPEPMAPISAARTKAALIYQRLTGIKAPIDSPILKTMEAQVASGDLMGAAATATNDPEFYNNTVKHFAARMSTREESISAGLNDFVATVIGIVRDDRQAREMLTGNYIYVPTAAAQSQPGFRRSARSQDDYGIATAGQLDFNMLRSNRVFDEMTNVRADLATGLEYRAGQPILVTTAERNDGGDITRQPVIRNNPDAAGLLTTRSFMNSHAIAGTNRRMVQYAFRQFLCIDIAQWADGSAPDSRIGRDVARDPGGDPNFFLRTCKACHSVMDGFRGAFASLDVKDGDFFQKQYIFTDQQNRDVVNANSAVASKYARGSGAFPAGYATIDSTWQNFANSGTNAEYFGWRGTNVSSGTGANSFGTLLSNSQAFSRCMVQRVYRSVCRRDLAASETEFLGAMTTAFERDYNMKRLFQRVTVSPACIGQ